MFSLFGQILGLESLLGSEDLWPVLLGLTVVPTVLQMGLLPFCPESPRFLYIIRCQEHQAKRGKCSLMASLALGLLLLSLLFKVISHWAATLGDKLWMVLARAFWEYLKTFMGVLSFLAWIVGIHSSVAEMFNTLARQIFLLKYSELLPVSRTFLDLVSITLEYLSSTCLHIFSPFFVSQQSFTVTVQSDCTFRDKSPLFFFLNQDHCQI